MQRLILILICILSLSAAAQDKLFFVNGQVKKGILVSIAKDEVFFKATDTSAMQRFKKSTLLMIENYKGVRYIFAEGKQGPATATSGDTLLNKVNKRQNYLGLQPLAIFVGRGTFVYERFTKDDKIGFVIPLSITFDPFGSLYNSRIDTSRNAVKRIKGVNFIAGLDVNFYLGKGGSSKFFIGPRARYGTDLFLRGVEGYSLQTQVGWKREEALGKFTQHLSIGFGFVRIQASPLGRLVNPKQSYGWYSLNYRLGIRW